uniref:Uncharacterized protein n=1 Tax=Panagrolaimus sp. JU765 TaxID=591449 RepID=A0AC34RDM0_9BILA
MSPRCDSVESGQATNLPESSMPSAKLNGLSHSQSQSSLLSNQNTEIESEDAGVPRLLNIEVESEDAGVPRLLVEAGFALFLMTFLVERHYWFWLAISFIVFRFFYSNLGRRCLKTLPRDLKGLYTLFRVKFIIKMAMRRNLPLHHYFLEHMRANPNAECVVDIE